MRGNGHWGRLTKSNQKGPSHVQLKWHANDIFCDIDFCLSRTSSWHLKIASLSCHLSTSHWESKCQCYLEFKNLKSNSCTFWNVGFDFKKLQNTSILTWNSTFRFNQYTMKRAKLVPPPHPSFSKCPSGWRYSGCIPSPWILLAHEKAIIWLIVTSADKILAPATKPNQIDHEKYAF